MVFKLGELSNRILIGHIKKKTKWKKETENVVKGSVNLNASSFLSASSVGVPASPMTPGSMNKSRLKFFDQFNTFGTKPYLCFLISQNSLNEIDEEQFIKDHKAISKPPCLEKYEFNTLYLFDYNGQGDNRPYHKMIPLR